MRYAKGAIHLNEGKDIPLLRQIFQSAYATQQQLFEFMRLRGCEQSERALRTRLARLVKHDLVKQAHAQVTPEAAVFDRKGLLLYHGRIDDLYHSFGRARPQPTTHELEDAIEAALAGRSPAKSEVPGVGCYISDLE